MLVLGLLSLSAGAHPGSGIVIDGSGNIYFTDTGSGIWRIDSGGKLHRVAGQAFHWMALDAKGHFAHFAFTDWFERVTAAGKRPAVLTCSDFPFVVGTDGGLYYGFRGAISRMMPDGKVSAMTPTTEWITGIALGPDGSLYVTSPEDELLKVARDGRVTIILSKVVVPECTADVPENTAPQLRGLAIDERGNAYVAASGCRAVVKITPQGRVETILKAEKPWSPTGVALRGKTLYILEYTHTPGDNRREWIPRVRRISRDGKVSVLATIERK